jgi:hypothetical protein
MKRYSPAPVLRTSSLVADDASDRCAIVVNAADSSGEPKSYPDALPGPLPDPREPDPPEPYPSPGEVPRVRLRTSPSDAAYAARSLADSRRSCTKHTAGRHSNRSYEDKMNIPRNARRPSCGNPRGANPAPSSRPPPASDFGGCPAYPRGSISRRYRRGRSGHAAVPAARGSPAGACARGGAPWNEKTLAGNAYRRHSGDHSLGSSRGRRARRSSRTHPGPCSR